MSNPKKPTDGNTNTMSLAPITSQNPIATGSIIATKGLKPSEIVPTKSALCQTHHYWISPTNYIINTKVYKLLNKLLI